MTIHIITNRSIDNKHIRDNGVERGLPTFRIAKCELDHDNETVTYNLLEDSHPEMYRSADMLCSSDDGKDLGSQKLFCDLYNNMSQSETPSDILFFIHGYAYTFNESKEHIYQLYKLYVEPKDSPIEHLVYFSWPTIGHIVLSYWDDQEDSEQAGYVVARLYNLLRGFYINKFELSDHRRCNHKIHLMVHSMANQVLKHALNKLDKNKYFKMFEEVFLLNSDVEWTVFEPHGAFTVLEQISERVHMYIHRSDDILRVSKYTKNWEKRLGSKGPKNISNLPTDVYIVDTTGTKQNINTSWALKTKEKLFDHWGYMFRREIVEDITSVLCGVDEDDIPNRHLWNLQDHYYYLGDKRKNDS